MEENEKIPVEVCLCLAVTFVLAKLGHRRECMRCRSLPSPLSAARLLRLSLCFFIIWLSSVSGSCCELYFLFRFQLQMISCFFFSGTFALSFALYRTWRLLVVVSIIQPFYRYLYFNSASEFTAIYIYTQLL